MSRKNRPPVFKIRAEIEIWDTTKPTPRPALVVVEECIGTVTPNRQDLKALAKSTAFGKLAAFGADTMKLDYQFLSIEILAARSRTYGGGFLEDEPEWTAAYDPYIEPADDAARAKAIRALTYLPADIAEQRAVYGA